MRKNVTPEYWAEAKKYLSKQDAVMKKIITAYKGDVGLVSRGSAFETLARSIVGQQVSVKAADSIWAKVQTLVQKPAAENFLAQPETALRGCGLSGRKVEYLHGLSRAFIEKTITPKRWAAMDDADVIADLTRLRGIGVWTAEMFLIFHLHRPDILPLDDIGLQKAVAKHYADGKGLSAAQITTLAKKWQPYRSVATWYLWRSLDPVPVAY